jgi:DNA polymerase-1
MNGQLNLFEDIQESQLMTTAEYASTFETKEQQYLFAQLNKVDYTTLFKMVDEMNTRGIKVSTARLDAHIADAAKDIGKAIKDWRDELTNQGIDYVDFTKAAALRTLFFTTLALPVVKTTPKGTPALDKKALDVLGQMNPLALIFKRIKSTQRVHKMLTNIRAAVSNERIYPQLHINGAASGRFTCDGVNVQQLPESIRDIIVADEGTLVYIDYSQIEYRVQATLAKDEKAIQAFRDGQDAHTQLATLLNISREKAKIVNYAVSYGMTAYGLAIELGTTEDEAQRIIDNYWRAKDKVAAKRQHIINWSRSHGFVPTIYGFSRSMSTITKDDQIWSTSIQGSAADLMKKCMVDVYKYLEVTGCGRVLTNVHDALLIDLKDMSRLVDIMNIFRNVDTRFVLDVDAKTGSF